MKHLLADDSHEISTLILIPENLKVLLQILGSNFKINKKFKLVKYWKQYCEIVKLITFCVLYFSVFENNIFRQNSETTYNTDIHMVRKKYLDALTNSCTNDI